MHSAKLAADLTVGEWLVINYTNGRRRRAVVVDRCLGGHTATQVPGFLCYVRDETRHGLWGVYPQWVPETSTDHISTWSAG